MLRLVDHRPFAVRMADKKLSETDPASYVKALYSDMPALADLMYRDIYARRTFDSFFRIDPIFPSDEIRLGTRRTPTFRHSVEPRWQTCDAPSDWIDRYNPRAEAVAVVGTDWSDSEAFLRAIFEQERAAISAAYDKAVIDAVLYVSIDRPVEWGPEFDLPTTKHPVDRKDPKSYLARDPTKSHKRGKRRRRK